MGGEKANGNDAPDDDEGSPPHGRGKVLATIGHNLNTGITPAWAGKRLPHPQRHQAAQDHPRVGGEKV